MVASIWKRKTLNEKIDTFSIAFNVRIGIGVIFDSENIYEYAKKW